MNNINITVRKIKQESSCYPAGQHNDLVDASLYSWRMIMEHRKRKTQRRNDRILFAFGLFITGLGWGVAGYLMRGIWLGVGMAIIAGLVVGISVLNIEDIV